MNRHYSHGLALAAFLCLLLADAAFCQTSQTVLVKKGSVWRYLNNGTALTGDWTGPGFDDRQWPSGPAQLGYGDGDEATVTRPPPNLAPRPITAYFRHSFEVADTRAFSRLIFRLLRDDGAAVYLNGREVFRENLPKDVQPLTFSTLALSNIVGAAENELISVGVEPAMLLVNGQNILAVEVHQDRPASSDLSFDLELIAAGADNDRTASLEITAPMEGQNFPARSTIVLEALAIDPAGFIPKVEFFANGVKIGESMLAWAACVGCEPKPGDPARHRFEWKNVAAGKYEIVAKASARLGPPPQMPIQVLEPPLISKEVHITVGEQASTALVSIEASSPIAEESSDPLRRLPLVGQFKITRTGPVTNSLTLFLLLSGTAIHGQDYEELPWIVTIPAGASSMTLQVKAKPDNIAEGQETVIAKLSNCPPVTNPPLGIPCFAFTIDPAHATATVLIRDHPEGVDAARIEITSPKEGDRFLAGVPIKIEATAIDPKGYISRLQFFADQQLIGVSQIEFFRAPDPGTPIYHSIEWREPKLGSHVLLARGTDAQGNLVLSKPVNILVTSNTASRIIFERDLPAAYVPGVKFTVAIFVRLPATSTGAGISAYAVEDQPPAGWTVGDITSEGVFDPVTGRVKFGPFTDGRERTLIYRVSVPLNASGARQFQGVGSADGVLYEISGDSSITTASPRHPADISPADNSISLAEVTAYAAAWKAGRTWSEGPNPIPLAYVTRAGLLWQRGEKYYFDVSAGSAPFWWVPGQRAVIQLSGAPETLSSVVREFSAHVRPNVPLKITLRAAPARGVSSYAIEDQPPGGWAVSAISDAGVHDPATGTIRWGLFLDDKPRALTYEVTPPAPGHEQGTFAGLASFEGSEFIMAGPSVAHVSPELRIAHITRLQGGEVQLTLTGDPAQAYYDLEVSTDLVHWTRVGEFMPGNYSFFFLDTSAADQARRFYRAVER